MGEDLVGTPQQREPTEKSFVAVDPSERSLGRYELSYEIGRGGMASVFLGRYAGPGGFHRAVAIKRMHAHLARERPFVDMFLDEARIGARIHHPNVCSVVDFGEASGTYFIAMEYLIGVSLADLFARVAEDPERLRTDEWIGFSCRIIADAAEGLHAAHEARDEDGRPLHVVHRDVSPQNVFITYDGAVKVVDFGVAQAERRLHQTRTGTLKGKASYMSPEQTSPGEIDRRADVWALGVVLWELLSGARLFRRDDELLSLLAVRSDPIVAPTQVNDAVWPELDVIVGRALQRARDDRYPTARALGRDLTELARKRSASTSLADLAEWIDGLFHKERTRKVKMVHQVLADGAEGTTTTAVDVPAPGVAATKPTRLPGGQAHPSAGDASTAELIDPAAASRRDEDLSRYSTPPAVRETSGVLAVGRPANGRTRWIAAGLLAACGAAAIGTLLASSDGDRPVTRVTANAPAASGRGGSGPAATKAAPAARDRAPHVSPAPAPEPRGDRRGGAPAEVPPPEPVPPGVVPASERPRIRGARDERPRPPAPDAVVDVATTGGWARVYADDRYLGQTPVRISLPAGRHRLRFVPGNGGRPVTRTVRFTSGAPQQLVVPLER